MNPSKDQLLRQALAVRGARATSLPAFLTRAAGAAYVQAPHLEHLASVLQGAEERPLRVCVSIPPGHGKSTLAASLLAWLTARWPSRVSAYASYSEASTRQRSSLIRDLSRGAGVQLDPDFESLMDWRTILRGGLLSTSVGGRLVGERISGCLVLDDPFKNWKDAQSRLVRENLSNWFGSVALTRLLPGASAVVIHTRWGRDDLIGRLSKLTNKDGTPVWTVISLPAINSRGEALWPGLFPLESLLQTKQQLDAINQFLWSALYQQDPTSLDSRLFQEPATYEPGGLPDPRDYRVVLGCDLAATTDRRNDPSALVVLAVRGHGPLTRAWVLGAKEYRLESPDLIREIAKEAYARPGCTVALEVNGLGLPVYQDFRRSFPDLNVVPVKRSSDKYTSSLSWAAAWNDRRVLLPTRASWVQRFMDSHVHFPSDDDHLLDAAVNAWVAASTSGATKSGNVNL